jgi:hypothetical protein
MNKIDLTLRQTGKIWWSFMWRGWVLMMPVMIIMTIAGRFLIPFPNPGEPPQPPDIKQMPIFFMVWLAMMVLFLLTQIFALRWALKTKWSDFRIVPVSASTTSED